MRRQQEQDQQSRVIYELCSLLLSILRPPPPSHPIPIRSSSYHPSRRTEVSPAGFASLLLGISLALMLCGSVTFVIGFILMPWVLGLVMVFYFVGLVSNLSGLGRAILMGTAAGPAAEPAGSTVRKEMPGVKTHYGGPYTPNWKILTTEYLAFYWLRGNCRWIFFVNRLLVGYLYEV